MQYRQSVRGVGGGYRFVGNARRLTLMDVIRTFEDLSPAVNDKREPGELTPVGTALGAVLSEIDEIAKATFSSITLATMLRLIERQQRSDVGLRRARQTLVPALPCAAEPRQSQCPGSESRASG